MKRLARLAPWMLLAALAAPASANAQYGAWTSGRAAGTTYKQAHARSAFGSAPTYGAGKQVGFGKGYGSHATYGGKSAYGGPKAHSGYGSSGGFHGYGHAPAPRKVWVAGHWALRENKVWIAGRTESVWRPARFETRYDACGLAFSVQIQAGHYETIQHPGRWEWRTQRVWVSGGWSHPR